MSDTHGDVTIQRLEPKGEGYPPSLVERAYQLAASGRFNTMLGIKRALQAAGYRQIDAHFSGYQLKAELFTLMRSSRGSSAPGEPPAIADGVAPIELASFRSEDQAAG